MIKLKAKLYIGCDCRSCGKGSSAQKDAYYSENSEDACIKKARSDGWIIGYFSHKAIYNLKH